jgi:hypothetical protein
MGWEAVEQSASTERENNYLTPPLHSNTADISIFSED